MITIILLAKNEALNLSQVLPQLGWADNIIVVDDYSTDETVRVSKQYGAHVIKRRLNGDFSGQRNFALSQVTSGWVLFLDPDERLNDELVQNIISKSKDQRLNKEVIGYAIKREDIFLGKKLKYGETKDIWLVRLGKAGSGVFSGKVHETWEISGAQRLTGTMEHHSHHSVTQLFAVVSNYALIRARELSDAKEHWNLFEQIAYPSFKFFYTFVLLLGFLDGWRGLLMSAAMSWHSFLVRWYLWDLPWLNRSIGLVIARYLLVFPWVLLPFGQLNRGQLPYGGAVYTFELFMGLAVFWCVIIKGKHKWFLPSWIGSFSLFSLILGLSYVLSPYGYAFSPILYWFRWLLYGAFLLVLYDAVRSEVLKISIRGLIQFFGYSLLLGGIIQFVFIPDTRWLFWLGWDDHYYRMIGTLFDPNYLGLLGVLFGWWIFNFEKGKIRTGGIVISLLCVLASYSRTSFLLSGLLLCIILFQNRISWRTLFMTLIGTSILFVLLPKPGGEGVNILRVFSITSRLDSWGNAAQWVQKYPILGIGYNYYPTVTAHDSLYGLPYHPTAPDSSWMHILVTSGVVGLGALMYMIISWWKYSKSNFMRISLILVMLHSFTNNSFFYPWVLLWLWLLLLQENEKITL